MLLTCLHEFLTILFTHKKIVKIISSFLFYYVPLAFTSDSAPESSSSIGLIAGAVAGILVIAVAVAVGVVLYKKHKARIKPIEHSDEEKVQPPGMNFNG